MSVRRLGADQPASFEFSEQNLAWAKATIAQVSAGQAGLRRVADPLARAGAE